MAPLPIEPTRVGFSQGQLLALASHTPPDFPWEKWPREFWLAQEQGFALLEWSIDQVTLEDNPLMTEAGRRQIRALCNRHQLNIQSLYGRCFMQEPFWKAQNHAHSHYLQEMMHRVVMATIDLGIRTIVLPLSNQGELHNEAQLIQLYDGLADLFPLLHRYHLRMAFESTLPPQQLRKFIQPLPSHIFGVSYDIGHSATLGYDLTEEMECYGDRIFNVYFEPMLPDQMLPEPMLLEPMLPEPMPPGHSLGLHYRRKSYSYSHLRTFAALYALAQVNYKGGYFFRVSPCRYQYRGGTALANHLQPARDWL